jgi:hypothetical protein
VIATSIPQVAETGLGHGCGLCAAAAAPSTWVMDSGGATARPVAVGGRTTDSLAGCPGAVYIADYDTLGEGLRTDLKQPGHLAAVRSSWVCHSLGPQRLASISGALLSALLSEMAVRPHTQVHDRVRLPGTSTSSRQYARPPVPSGECAGRPTDPRFGACPGPRVTPWRQPPVRGNRALRSVDYGAFCMMLLIRPSGKQGRRVGCRPIVHPQH